MNPRVISELRYLGRDYFEAQEQRILLQRCRSCMTRLKGSYRIVARNTRAEYTREEER